MTKLATLSLLTFSVLASGCIFDGDSEELNSAVDPNRPGTGCPEPLPMGYQPRGAQCSDLVFVSAAVGSSEGQGTGHSPLATLGEGLDAAEAIGAKHVIVSEGHYSESIVLRNGISIHGGYTDEWKAGGPAEFVGNPVLQAKDISDATVVRHLHLRGDDGENPGESAHGAIVVDSPGLKLMQLRIEAGRGRDGVSGEDGVDGTDGSQASYGVPGNAHWQDGNNCPAWVEPVPYLDVDWKSNGTRCYGGRGAGYRSLHGQSLRVDEAEAGWCGDSAQPGQPVVAGQRGNPGERGADGADGQGGEPATGSFTRDGYVATQGSDGQDGVHGGGGGGGAMGGRGIDTNYAYCDIIYGGGGGTGGDGGQAGTGGAGALGGGASIALLVWGPLYTEDLTLVAGNGGDGGDGGLGSVGGEGGFGGRGGQGRFYNFNGVPPGAGGDGGFGGDGGRGGEGGGAAGGPSYALVLVHADLEEVGNTYLFGRGGENGRFSDVDDVRAGERHQVGGE